MRWPGYCKTQRPDAPGCPRRSKTQFFPRLRPALSPNIPDNPASAGWCVREQPRDWLAEAVAEFHALFYHRRPENTQVEALLRPALPSA
jgi:hypothetical protein